MTLLELPCFKTRQLLESNYLLSALCVEWYDLAEAMSVTDHIGQWRTHQSQLFSNIQVVRMLHCLSIVVESNYFLRVELQLYKPVFCIRFFNPEKSWENATNQKTGGSFLNYCPLLMVSSTNAENTQCTSDADLPGERLPCPRHWVAVRSGLLMLTRCLAWYLVLRWAPGWYWPLFVLKVQQSKGAETQ